MTSTGLGKIWLCYVILFHNLFCVVDGTINRGIFTMSAFSNVSALLLTPVHFAIYALFIVALFESGRLIVQWFLRVQNRKILQTIAATSPGTASVAFPIIGLANRQSGMNVDDLDLEAMRRLEFIRIATRITPMLGLIATLIPMGPALVALTKNDVAIIEGEHSQLVGRIQERYGYTKEQAEKSVKDWHSRG